MKRLIHTILLLFLLTLPVFGAAKPTKSYPKPCKDSAGLWGYKDSLGNWVISPKYKTARLFSEGLAPVQFHKRWGYINQKGKTILPFRYSDAGSFLEGRAPVQLEHRDSTSFESAISTGHYGYINKRGKLVIAPVYNEVCLFQNGRACAGRWIDGKLLHGFINRSGETVIPFEFHSEEGFLYGQAGLFVKDKKYYVLRPDGSMVFPEVFESYYNGCFNRPNRLLGYWDKKVNRMQYGVLDENGKTMIPFQYDSLLEWNYALYLGKQNGKWGIIHRREGVKVPLVFDDAKHEYFDSNWFALKNAEGWTIFDSAARKIDLPDIDSLEYHTYVMYCYIKGKVGLWHKSSLEWLKPPVYENAISIGPWGHALKYKGKYGFISGSGKEATGYRFDSVIQEKGIQRVRENNLWGYYYWMKNRLIVEPKYHEAKPFRYRKAEVCINGCWGVINDKAETVIPLQYDAITHYGDSLFIVKKNGKYKLADYNGKIQTEPVFTKVYPVKHPLMRVELNGKTGYINKIGTLVIPTSYAEGLDFQEAGGYVSVRKPGSEEWIKLDVDGREVIKE